MLLHADFSLASGFDVKRRYKIDSFFFTSHKSCGISQFPLPLSRPQNDLLSVRSIYDTVLSVKEYSGVKKKSLFS